MIVIFQPMTSIKKTDFLFSLKGVKRTRKTVTLRTKMLVIEKWKLARNVLIWTSNENYGTNYDNLDMLIKKISEIAEVGVDNVDPMGITGVLGSHSQPLANAELHDLAQNLTEQQKEDEDEVDRGTKTMQTNGLLMFFRYRYGS